MHSSELNKWHQDNLMTHMAAISLYIDNFRTDTHELREDLRLENKQFVSPFLLFPRTQSYIYIYTHSLSHKSINPTANNPHPQNVAILCRTRLQSRRPDREGASRLQDPQQGSRSPAPRRQAEVTPRLSQDEESSQEAVDDGHDSNPPPLLWRFPCRSRGPAAVAVQGIYIRTYHSYPLYSDKFQKKK